MCFGIWNSDQKKILWERRKINQTWHMLFFWHEDVAFEREDGVTLLTKAGSASCLIPTSNTLFLLCQWWQINRKAFSWGSCRLQKCFTWIISVSKKRCIGQYWRSSATESVMEVLWTRASFAPHAWGRACVDLKDEGEILSLVYHGKGRLRGPKRNL